MRARRSASPASGSPAHSSRQAREGAGGERLQSRGGAEVTRYDDLGAVYFVAAGLMPDLDLEPSFHQQVAYKASWHKIGDDAPQYAELP